MDYPPMRHPSSRNTARTSGGHTTSRQDLHYLRKQRRRRRLIPLLAGICVIAVLIVWAAVSLGTNVPESGAAMSTPSSIGSQDSAIVPEGSGEVSAIDRARSLNANEMGQVPVLMYHLIGHTDSQYNRTPEDFRQDIADLEAAGYYPINACDLASGNIDIPAGKSPVVITFDDSSGGQYRITATGELDPDCAVAIMQAAANDGEWTGHASFFPLLEVDAPDRIVFGQPEFKEQKLRQLVSWGYEVGSHTVTHLNLKKASTAEAMKQLCQSKQMLEEMIGGSYEVTSIAVPFGEYPAQASLLKSGEYNGQTYTYQAALRATGGPSLSPFSDGFQSYHIPRIEVSGTSLRDLLAMFERSPELRYISDGDPSTISIPLELDVSLGSVASTSGQEVIRY